MAIFETGQVVVYVARDGERSLGRIRGRYDFDSWSVTILDCPGSRTIWSAAYLQAATAGDLDAWLREPIPGLRPPWEY